MSVIHTNSAAVFECKSKACAPPPVGAGGSGGGGKSSSPTKGSVPAASARPRRFGTMNTPKKRSNPFTTNKVSKTSDLLYRPEKDQKKMQDGVYRGGPQKPEDIQWL